MALIQTAKQSFSSTGATITIAFLNPTHAKNTIIVGYSDGSGANVANCSLITDNFGNTYTETGQNGTLFPFAALFYAPIVTGGLGHTLTLNIDPLAQGTDASVIIREYSGIYPNNAYDTGSGNNGSDSSPHSLATQITVQAQELVIGYVSIDISTTIFTAGSGWGNLVSETSNGTVQSAMEDRVLNAIGTTEATFSLSESPDWACVCATFKLSVDLPVVSVANTSYRFIDSVVSY